MNSSAGSHPRISVVGIGNVLLGDDGFGPVVVEMFRCKYECGSNVEILDLGTPGLDLAPYLYGTDLVVIADAVHAEAKPGTLCIYCEADLLAHRAQLRVTAHHPAVQESLANLRLAGNAPSELIIVGVVPESCGFGNGLSPSVLSASSVAADHIARLLVERAVDCCRRHTPIPPNFWWLSGDRSDFVASHEEHQGQIPEPVGAGDMFSRPRLSIARKNP